MPFYTLSRYEDNCKRTAERLEKNWLIECKRPHPRLWMAAAKTVGPLYLLGGLLFFMESVSRIAQAVFLGYLLDYVAATNPNVKDGYLYALGLSLNVIFVAIAHHIDFFFCMRAGLHLRTSMMTLIYKKLLSLPLAHTTNSGFIINLASNDVQRFEDAAPFANFLWLGIF